MRLKPALPSLLLALAACTPAGAATVAPPAPGPGGECSADLEAAMSLVRSDYAGFRARTSGREVEVAALADSLRGAVAADSSDRACTAAIRSWIAFFSDPHLSLTARSAAPARRARPAAAPTSGAPREDPRRPSLRFPDDSTAVLRLPSFSLEQSAAIDSLIASARERLLATPYLVVDVRRNGGGWSGSYAPVLPLLYTGPILVHGWDTWSSPANLAEMRAGLEFPAIPPAIARQIREVLPRMEAAPGEFVLLEEDHELRLDTVHPLPRAVAVLVDRRCASSCEQFVVDSRQSAKVRVMGAESTLGALEYGNVREVPLPSRARQLSLPIARSHWARLHPAEARGLAPDVLIPRDEVDPVAFARRQLGALPLPRGRP